MTPRNDLVFVGIMPVTGPQPTKADAELFALLNRTPEGRQVLSILSTGPGPHMGTWKIFKKIGKGLKAVGKITRPFTTALAKTFLPSGVVNALAKVDPTAKNKLTDALSKALPEAQKALTQATASLPAFAPVPAQSNLKRNLLIGGGVAVVVLGAVLLLRPKRSAVPAAY